jgi:hypothetical protein
LNYLIANYKSILIIKSISTIKMSDLDYIQKRKLIKKINKAVHFANYLEQKLTIEGSIIFNNKYYWYIVNNNKIVKFYNNNYKIYNDKPIIVTLLNNLSNLILHSIYNDVNGMDLIKDCSSNCGCKIQDE